MSDSYQAVYDAVIARLTAELAAAKQERDELAVALGKIAEDLGYENDPVHIDPAAILATVRAKARAEALTELLKTASITFDEDVVPLGYNASIEEAEIWLAAVKSRAKAEGWAEGMRKAGNKFHEQSKTWDVFNERSKVFAIVAAELDRMADAEEKHDA